MFRILDQIVAEARVSQGPGLARLDELERAYDGPIAPALRFEHTPIITAYNAVAEMRFWIRGQIEAIRGWQEYDHLPPTQHGERMARLYRELRRLWARYRHYHAELMTLLQDAEARRAQFLQAAE